MIRPASLLLLLLLACSGPSPRHADVPTGSALTPRDRELCSMLCAKQRECLALEADTVALEADTVALEVDAAALEVDTAGIERCAAGCFANLEQRPALVARLRATTACLGEPCGEDYDRCSRGAEAEAARRVELADPPAVDPLTTDQCRVVCRKTLECLGARDQSRAVDGCVLGCEAGSREPAQLRRNRAVLRCASSPCGPAFQDCVSSAP